MFRHSFNLRGDLGGSLGGGSYEAMMTRGSRISFLGVRRKISSQVRPSIGILMGIGIQGMEVAALMI